MRAGVTESYFRQNRIFAFFAALVIIFGIFSIILTLTSDWFLPLVEERGWLDRADPIP